MKKLTNYLLPIQTKDLYAKEAVSSISLAHEVADKINEIVSYLNTHEDLTNEKILEQDGKIRKGIIYMKDNLANTINDLLELMKANGEVDELIRLVMTDDYLKKTDEIRNLFNLPGGDLQELFNKCCLIYIPKDTYVIDKPIILKDNTIVVCSDEAVFKLKDNSKCVMFRTTNEPHKNITWIGGILDGNDSGQGVRETSATNNEFDFSNGFRFYEVSNLIVKNVKIKNVRGHGIEHWNCNNVVFDNIEFSQDYDLVNFPLGGSRRDGISGGSSNIIINNIYGFTDDDLIGFIAGSPWHESKPMDLENVTITNIFPKFKNKRPTYSAVRINVCEGKTLKNVHVSNVYGTTQRPAIRVGGYDQYYGTLKNITIDNVDIECINNWDEEGCILVEQGNIDKLTLNNINTKNASTYRPSFLLVNNATIKELIIDKCKLDVVGEFTDRVVFIKINQDETKLKPTISGDIERITINNTSFKYDESNNILLLVQGTHPNSTPIRLELNELDYNDTKFKYTVGVNNSTKLSINSPKTLVSNNILDDSIQKNGDVVMCNNGDLYVWVENERYTLNNKPYWKLLESDVSIIDVTNLGNRALVKLNVAMNITGISGTKYGQEITLLCGKSGTSLTHSDTFRLKGETNANMVFMNSITFIRDNTGRWVEITRNF